MQFGKATLSKIASQIKEDLEVHTKTTGNFPFSMLQLEDKVIFKRNEAIITKKTNKMLDATLALQEINCIELDQESFDLCCDVDTKCLSAHFIIPRYIHLEYIGTPDREIRFKFYEDDMSKYQKYKDPRLAKRPYIRFRYHQGVVHGFIFNLPNKAVKKPISVSAIWENPYDVNIYSCCNFNPRETTFPVPPDMIDIIIKSVVNDVANTHYRLNYKPNTQQSQP